MLLRTLALLLLCLSSGMCATLALLKTQGEEIDSPTEIPDLDTVSAAAAEVPEVEPAAVDAMVADTPVAEALADESEAEADTPAAEDPVANDIIAEDPVADTLVAEDPVANNIVAEDPVANNIIAEDPVADALVTEDSVADALVAEDPVADSPAAAEEPQLHVDEPAADIPAAEDPAEAEPVADVAEEPVPETPAAADAPLPEEALDQEAPTEEELENEIEAFIKSQQEHAVAAPEPEPVQQSSWGMGILRGGFARVSGYFDSMVELVGGRNGVCEYRCHNDETPKPRPGFQIPEPNGCSTSLMSYFQFSMGVPAMTKCCDVLDECYDTCGMSKHRCDSKFRWCMHGICADVKKTLGFNSEVQACETFADSLYSTVGTLGCRPYLNSQRAACVCPGERKDEL